MKLNVRVKDDEGNLVVDGSLNRQEMSFLLNYAIADLLNAGVKFYLDKSYDETADEEEDDESQIRFEFPERNDLN